ncbi:MAG: hypothetical protein QXO69_02315 [archaeon]
MQHASGFAYKDQPMDSKLLSLKCKAHDQTMHVFKEFYCWYSEKK